MVARRILILAAHPDDEVVACHASAARARGEGAALFILYLTHGCMARDRMWPWKRSSYDAMVARRLAEGDAAARAMGATLLNRPTRPARHLWREVSAVAAEIDAALTQCGADQMWAPAYEGGNADHDTLNGIAARFRDRVEILEFAEYNFFGGHANAQSFPYPNGTETIIALTEAEQAAKRAALAAYPSERGNLGYVGTTRECSRPLAPYDYSHPPHPGTLWYARFHWVPFCHPRIDFTKPDMVSGALEKPAAFP